MSGIDFHPYDYQERMRAFLRERETEAGLFCSPGLGKTAITLEWLDWLFTTGRSRGALIVAPLRVGLVTWPNQAAHWNMSSWMKVVSMRTPEGAEAWEKGSAHLYTVNFEALTTREVMTACKTCKGAGDGFPREDGLGCPTCFDPGRGRSTGRQLRKDHGFLHKFMKGRRILPVDTLVIDELSILKDPSGVRAAALRAYRKKFKQVLGLTGTPVPNNYLDLFNQIRMLDDGKRLGNVFGTRFRDVYFDKADRLGYRHKLKPGAKEQIDAKIADLCLVMLGDDYLDLPTTSVEDVMVELPAKAREHYKTLEKELLVQLDTGEIEAVSAAVLCNKLLQVTSGSVFDADKKVHAIHDVKLKALRKLRKRHAGEPMLALTGYTHEKERILKEFPEARLFHEKDLPLWQAGKIPMWVAAPQSLSHGIDGIQKGGRIAVWMTPTYSAEMYLQTNARLIRKGQSNETIVYRVLVGGSIDEAVVEAIRAKDDEQTGLMQALKALQKITNN